MANLINKLTGKVLLSVNTPDYDEGEWLVNPPGLKILIANNVPQRFWKITADDVVEMSDQEKADVKAIDLETFRISYVESTGLQVQAYIEKHYADRKQRSLTFLYSEAQKIGDAASVALIQKAWDWVITVIQGYYLIKRQILTATTVDEIKGLVFDTASYDATDPLVTIEQVFALQGR